MESRKSWTLATAAISCYDLMHNKLDTECNNASVYLRLKTFVMMCNLFLLFIALEIESNNKTFSSLDIDMPDDAPSRWSGRRMNWAIDTSPLFLLSLVF